ncbi:MAG: 3'-5' exonuclease [Anaerolineae bacterium]|nr:3'-5' exonuclease [Anaerolineae bacterium]
MSFLDLVIRGGYVVLDTETTGIGQDAEIVQIAVIDSSGQTLLDTLVRPVRTIPADASRIHGITDAMVADAPTFPALMPKLIELLTGQDIIVYNATFDRRMFHTSAEACGLPKTEWKTLARWHCAMEFYAELWGEWNEWHQSYRWQKLTAAIYQQGIEIDVRAHSALGDCLMTLALIKKLAADD